MNHCMQYSDPKVQLACIHSDTVTTLGGDLSFALVALAVIFVLSRIR